MVKYNDMRYNWTNNIDEYNKVNAQIDQYIFTIFSAFTRPFQILFKTDANELTGNVNGVPVMAQLNEQSDFPGGIVGFQLNFNQVTYPLEALIK